MPQNIYLYVDESGQETEGVFFVVAVVMASQDLDACYQTCVELEQQSGKLARKWTKVQHSRRMEYLRLVFQNRLFAGNLAYMVFENTRNYDDLKAHVIALATQATDKEADKTVIIDGLPKDQWKDWGKRIRKAGGSTHRTRGANDKNDALIRLADSLCGLIRSALYEEHPGSKALFYQAVRDGILRNLA